MSEAPPSDEWARQLLAEIRELRTRINQVEDQLMRHGISPGPSPGAAERAEPSCPAPAASSAPEEPIPVAPVSQGPAAGQSPPPPPPPPPRPGVAKPGPVEPPPLPKGRDMADLLAALTDSARQQGFAGPTPPAPAPAAATEKKTPAPPAAKDTAPAPAPAAPAPAPPAAPAPRKPARSLAAMEQTVGTKWMLLAGVVLLMLGGAFFFRYAHQRGWITPPRRCLNGVIMATIMLFLGEWSVRKKMRRYAVALFGVGIVWHYYTAWAGSPAGPYAPDWRIFSREFSLGYMIAATLIGALLALRSHFQATAIISLVGAVATPVLLRSGQDQQVALMSYMLLVNAGFLLLAYGKRWQSLAPLALLGSVLLFSAWYLVYYQPEAFPRTCLFAWGLMAEFLIYAVVSMKTGRDIAGLGVGLTTGSPALVGVLSLVMDPDAGAFMGQLCALNAVVLGVCYWRRWQGVAPAALLGLGTLVWAWFGGPLDSASRVWTLTFAWTLFGTFVLYAAAALATGRAKDVITGGMVGAAAAMLGVLLWAMGISAGPFFAQVLALATVVLAMCLWRRWRALAAGALAGVAVLGSAWCACYYAPADQVTVNVFAWCLLGVFVAYSAIESLRGPGRADFASGLAGAGVAAAGVVLLVLALPAGSFFAQLLALTVGALAVSLWCRWPAVPLLAVAGVPMLFAVWMGGHYQASQSGLVNGYAWALLGVFGLYGAVAGAMGRVKEDVAGAVVAVAGALMAALLVGLALSAPAFWGQMAGLTAVVLGLCFWRRWGRLACGAAVGAAAACWAWMAAYYAPADLGTVMVMAWVLAGEFLAYAGASSWLARATRGAGAFVVLAVGVVLCVLWLGVDLSATSVLGQLLALNAVVLALCLWRRWNGVRAGLLAWTAVTMGAQWLGLPESMRLWPLVWPLRGVADTDAARLLWAGWIWAIGGLLLADVLVRAFWKSRRTDEVLDGWLGSLTMSMLFAGTWRLLSPVWPGWMGLYTALLAGATLGIGWCLLRLARRRKVALSFFFQGLVLAAVAMPIQFDGAPVALAWAIQGVVAMALAKRLRHWMLLVKSPIMLALAVGHLLLVTLREYRRDMEQEFLHLLDVSVSNGLATAVAVTAALLAAAAILRWGRAVLADGEQRALGGWLVLRESIEPVLARALVLTAVLLYVGRTVRELPPLASTWWWLVLLVGLGAVAAWRRSRWVCWMAVGVLLAGTGKYLGFDTMARRVLMDVRLAGPIVWNARFGAGVALGVLLLVAPGVLRRRTAPRGAPNGPAHWFLALLGVATILWAGSFEVDNVFNSTASAWGNLKLARQMGMSLWWGVYAVVLLVVGFVYSLRGARYFAIVLLAAALGKVFLVDMAGVDAAYRILSFLGTGVLLLAGSWLYHRNVRAVAVPEEADASHPPPVREQGPPGAP